MPGECGAAIESRFLPRRASQTSVAVSDVVGFDMQILRVPDFGKVAHALVPSGELFEACSRQGMVLICWLGVLATASAAGNSAGPCSHAGFLVAVLGRNDTPWRGRVNTIAS
jgi:hypothetical protein